jgi:hypothetical protein
MWPAWPTEWRRVGEGFRVFARTDEEYIIVMFQSKDSNPPINI